MAKKGYARVSCYDDTVVVGCRVRVYGWYADESPWEGVVLSKNDIGQPYVIPDHADTPRYLHGETVEVL